MSTLQEVEAWIATISPGSSVDVSASLFDSTIVTTLFGLLPDADPMTLTVTAADASTATLSGTATVLGEAGTTAAFVFTQPASDLVLTLTLTPPASLGWSLHQDLDVSFTGLTVTFLPDTDLNVVGLNIAATVVAGGSGELSVPVDISIPSFDGEWHVSAGTVAIGKLTDDALTALAGNVPLLSLLPAGDFQELDYFKLTGLEVAIDPSAGTCSLIRVGLGYAPPAPGWQFFGGNFTVTELDLSFTILEPFVQSKRDVAAELDAHMKIGPVQVEVGGVFPEKVVFAELEPGTTLNVTDALGFLHVRPPSGFPDIEISTLAFTFYTASDAFDFRLGIDKPVHILGDASLDGFFFEIGATYDQTSGAIEPSGSLYSRFTIGPSVLMLSGTYATTGVTLEGEVDDVAIDDLAAKLHSEFGITLPGPIAQMDLKTVKAALDTGRQTFDFTCVGTTKVADVDVAFTANVDLTYGAAFSAKFYGTLALTSGDRTLEFSVTFSTDAKDTWITAEYKGTALGLTDLAEAVDFTLPADIPPDLDLGLSAVGLFYDFTGSVLVVGAKSDNYGTATLATMPLAGTRQFFFILDAGPTFSLSNLPLVGHELARVENVAISNLQAIIASTTVGGDQAGIVNTDIAKLVSAPYPKLPDAGITGAFILSAQLAIGTDVRPLNVGLGGGAGSTALALAAGAPPAAGGPTWINVQKSFGPVSIQRLGILYQSDSQTLWFELDADLAFGPLALSLAGAGIGSPLKSFSPQFTLQGLGVAYDKPPLKIAGGLVNLAAPGADYIEFEGGLTVSTAEFSLEAFGYYGNPQGYSSMFVFAAAAYPFGGPPAFFVTGLAGGFGYNSNLRIPTIAEVGSFPFVVVLPTSSAPNPSIFGANPTPVDVLDVIRNKGWVTDEAGALWVAAGLTFTSFELVTGEALIMVDAGDELVIALVGVASAQFPQAVDQQSGAVFAHVELDILIRLAPTEGVFSAQAQLAPSSFVLDRACVITGGFAFFIWFGRNAHAGDFVLSLGGYHPAYTPPSYYPVVPRVGFHWSVDDSITVSGGAYVAITPAVLMAGGALNATYQSGNLKAWFDAHADVLIRWKPFWVDAEVGITVGASYKLNLLFTSHTVSVELGCDLEVWGPPTGGTVTVDWYVISFTIDFGASRADAPKIQGWSDVETMLPNTAPAGGTRNVLSLTPTGGLVTQTTSPPARVGADAADPAGAGPWTARGGRFAFVTATAIPATTATVGNSHAFNGDAFDVHPLGWTGVTSAYAVTIVDTNGVDHSDCFTASRTTSNAPASLWGSPPESQGKPQVPPADGQLVPDQMLGVAIQVLPPELGASVGPIDVEAQLSSDDLELPGADLPLSSSAQPAGDVPVAASDTVARIASPSSGIASANVTAARDAIYDALQAIAYVPKGCDDPMTSFAGDIAGALAAEPLLVA